jgi:hypothetical protein
MKDKSDRQWVKATSIPVPGGRETSYVFSNGQRALVINIDERDDMTLIPLTKKGFMVIDDMFVGTIDDIREALNSLSNR